MTMRMTIVVFAAALLGSGFAAAEPADPERDILVTFTNEGARSASAGFRAPYHTRKRYAISAGARRDARAVQSDYGLREVDHWPIRSLSVYCFVYRVPDGTEREELLQRLRADSRIESAQALQVFEPGTRMSINYDDKFANLQHGLDSLDIGAAHKYSLGKGVRIAIIDSHYDDLHEDLKGRVASVSLLTDAGARVENHHGTAVISVIGARSNNSVGIVGIAPDAELQLLVSCWASDDAVGAICDSFTLAKALDLLAAAPPDVLNLSLTGPYDPLVARLLDEVYKRGVVIVAAASNGGEGDKNFPASMENVIAVSTSPAETQGGSKKAFEAERIFAPGDQILVAVPDNAYDFRSGASLAAAHVSGVIALLLSVAPGETPETVRQRLQQSQGQNPSGLRSINACGLLRTVKNDWQCEDSIDEAQAEDDS